jgi:type I restriction-modification system DNA methylase subunit
MTYSDADHLDKETRQEQGSFFTPRELALEMASRLEVDAEAIVLDPCVGRGNLLKAVMELHPEIPHDNYYGCDVDVEAIRLCRGDPELEGVHLQVGDCLVDDLTDDGFWKKRWDERYEPGKMKSGFSFGAKSVKMNFGR